VSLRAEEEKARRYAQLLSAYRSVFDSPEGKLVLMDLMREAGVLSPSFAEPTHMGDGVAVALRAAHKEGRRSLFLYILGRRETPVEEVFTQMEEMIRDAHDLRKRSDEPGLDWNLP
jgi:hypothetical protein